MSHVPWFEQAESDLDAAKALSKAGFHSQAIWCASQSAEKALKAVLLSVGVQLEDADLKKVLGHELTKIQNLLPEPLQLPVDPNIGKAAARLAQRSQICRYPGFAQTAGISQVIAPTKRFVDSKDDVSDAESLLNWSKARITRALRGVAAMNPP